MRTHLVPIVFAILWSTGYIGGKLGAPYAEPFTFLTLRFVAVLALLAPVMVWLRAPWPRGPSLVHALVSGALLHGIYLGCIYWAIAAGLPTSIAALVISLQPLTTAVLAAPLLGERLSARQWLGLGVGLGGTVLVLRPSTSAAAPGVDAATLSAAVIALLSMTIGTIYQKRVALQVDARTGFTTQFVGAALTTGAIALAFETRTVSWTGEFIFALVWLVLVLSLGAFGLLVYMLRSNAVSRVAAYFYLIPAITAVMAFALFGEQLAPAQLAGMALACLAVLLAAPPAAASVR